MEDASLDDAGVDDAGVDDAGVDDGIIFIFYVARKTLANSGPEGFRFEAVALYNQ